MHVASALKTAGTRALGAFVLAMAVSSCNGGSSNTPPPPGATPTPMPTPTATPAPTPTPTPGPPHLYLADSQQPLRTYPLPLTATSTPDLVTQARATEFAFDSTGNLATVQGTRVVSIYVLPLTGGSQPAVNFATNGDGNYDVVFTPAGDLFIANRGMDFRFGTDDKVYFYTHPFSTTSVAASSIAALGLHPTALALDGAQTLYVSSNQVDPNTAPNQLTSQLFTFVPPYSGAPAVITPPIRGFYRGIALSATQLFVAQIDYFVPTGRIDVYMLPLTASSAPAFTITSGINVPQDFTFDSTGKLYVVNGGNATVTVYAPPFSAASAPTVTFTSSTSSLSAVAIGR